MGKTWWATFRGRRLGAIGAMCQHDILVAAETAEEAEQCVRAAFEHVLLLRIVDLEEEERLLSHGTREDIITWLVRNDGNGIYSDEQSIAEGLPPMTREQAAGLMRTIRNRD